MSALISPAPVAERPQDRLFGTAAAIFEAGLTGGLVEDLYEGDGARLYEALLSPVVADIRAFVRVARTTRGPVVDLACGSGRLTFPLAQRGLDVLGVDLSADMLDLLRERAAGEAPEVQARIALAQGDMSALDEVPEVPDAGIGLATLAATSIVLLHRAADRRRLFAGVSRRLAPDGRFALDVPVHDLAQLDARPERHSVRPHRDTRGAEAVTVISQRFQCTPEGRTELVNMLTESCDGSEIRRRVTTTRKAVFVIDELESELAQGGLRIVARRPGGDGVVFLECAPDTSRHLDNHRERG